MMGWVIITWSCLYAGWLVIGFVVAVPPPDYLIPRMVVVAVGIVAGWALTRKR